MDNILLLAAGGGITILGTFVFIGVVIGLIIAAGFSLLIISHLLKKSNNLGDVLPGLSDYSTDSFGPAFFGKNYGRTRKKTYDFKGNVVSK